MMEKGKKKASRKTRRGEGESLFYAQCRHVLFSRIGVSDMMSIARKLISSKSSRNKETLL
jgi:hypothetical protein